MEHTFSEQERRLVAEIVAQHRELSQQIARVELALRVAISALCAAHGLDGDWRISDDLTGLVPAARQHEGEATVQVKLEHSHGDQ